METGVGAVGDVDVTAVVDFDIVGLDDNLTLLIRALADAALVGLIRLRGNKVADFRRGQEIANIDRPHSRIELREKDEPLVVDRVQVLIRRMRAKASATVAE